jgi:phosphoglycolate phosphatase-like HAD superfamily hydrolase
VPELLGTFNQKQVRTAVFTRNSRGCTLATLERFGLTFDAVLSRDDAPPKPDPQGILDICRKWNLQPTETAVVGDYVFDLKAGRAAGARTVLFARGNTPEQIAAWTPEADLILHDFSEPGPLLDWLSESI